MLGESLSRLRRLQADAASTFRGEAPSSAGDAPADLLQRVVRFGALVGRSFWQNRCQTRAAALAYTTLLALIPLLAVSLSVASLVFDTESEESRDRLAGYIERFVENVAPALGLVDAGTAAEAEADLVGPPAPGSDAGRAAEAVSQQRQNVANQILGYTRKIHFGTIGVTAMAGLIFLAISLLRTVESTFNDIWGVARGRGWFDSIVLYWAAITLGPIVMLVGTTSGYLTALYEKSSALQQIPGAALFQTQLLPLLLLWVAFVALYKLAPNTRVHLAAAGVGGAVAVVLWWGNNRLGVLYNTKVVTYSKIYGSLGAVPLFLIGLYFSWMILLFGAQVAYVFQNRRSYLQEQVTRKVSPQSHEFVALRLVADIARRFDRGAPPATAAQLAEHLGVPERLVSGILARLRTGRLVEETDGILPAYLPARPLAHITCLDVLRCIRAGQDPLLATRPSPDRDLVRSEFDAILAAEAARGSSTSIDELVRRLASASPDPAPEANVLPASPQPDPA